jgi:hypothetical protein
LRDRMRGRKQIHDANHDDVGDSTPHERSF